MNFSNFTAKILAINHYVWLTLSLLFLFVELYTPGLFFFIAFFVGALTAALTSFLGYPFYLQCWAFLVTSIVSFAILRKYFSTIIRVKSEKKTNSYALVGRRCVVINEILPQSSGRVKLRGELWPARSEVPVGIGEVVTVLGIEGNHLIVRKQ